MQLDEDQRSDSTTGRQPRHVLRALSRTHWTSNLACRHSTLFSDFLADDVANRKFKMSVFAAAITTLAAATVKSAWRPWWLQ